jgi:rod shape-determining protein MreD
MVKTVVSATLIGWIMDSLIGGIVGVFGFSRAIIAFFLNEFNRFLDLRKKVFVFLLIFVSLSISNLIANVFFHLIFGYDLELGMILRQPLLTAILGLLIITPARVREYLDVY